MSKDEKVQVVMLATNNDSSIMKSRLDSPANLYFNAKGHGYDPYKGNQHLYFLSDEEIKEGDWVFNLADNMLVKCLNESHTILIRQSKSVYKWKKVISSTDQSLDLPRPSNSFVQKFVEEYNNGNVITEVMVEYEGDWDDDYKGWYANTIKLKVAPDNTITIKDVAETRGDIVWNYNKSLRLGELNPSLGDWPKENYEVPKRK